MPSDDAARLGAAAVIAIVAVAVPVTSALTRPPGTSVALEQQVDAPITATVLLSEVAWGTRLDMTCRYGAASDAPSDGWAYALVVVDRTGAESVLSTWRARPDTTAQLSAGTELDVSEIAAVEIRAAASGDVLMRSDIGAVAQG